MKNVYKHGSELLNELKETKLPKEFIAVWNMGQSSFIVKHNDLFIITDPNLENTMSERPVNPVARNFSSPLSSEQMDFVDYVFITHNHGDHLEIATIKGILKCNSKAKFIVPAPVINVLLNIGVDEGRIIPAHTYRTQNIGEIVLTSIPAAHYEIKKDENGDADMLSYIMKFGDVCVYHAGDTIVYPGMIDELKKHSIDIAMVPINGRDYSREGRNLIGNINFREAADLCRDIAADLLVPMHYDLYNHNTENPAFMVDYLFRVHKGMKYHLFQPGERFIYTK